MIIRATILTLLGVWTAAGAAVAAELDWTQDPVAQSSMLLLQVKDSDQFPPIKPVAVSPAPVKPQDGKLSFYQGAIKIGNETRSICFALAAEKIDRFEGDPDMPQNIFFRQEIPLFQESGQASCQRTLEHNGGYIQTCSGLFLLEAPALSKGPVFNTLERFDSATRALIVQPIGSYELKPASGCPSAGN